MKKLIVGNWKMNPVTFREASALFKSIKMKVARRESKCVICPPSIYLDAFVNSPGKCAIGAQDAYFEREGAFTGNISAAMLKKEGADYVILGHSERRSEGDTNEIVNKKVHAALTERLIVILCIGEHERDEEGAYLSFLNEEIQESLAGVAPAHFKNIVIAYEPIWAIGKKAKKPATPEDYLEKSIFIRKVVSTMTNKDIAMKLRILYGGSVNEKNAEEFFAIGRADGFLIGRASRNPDTYGAIVQIADNYK
tara:strand:- start:614 stop:1369 length:756 start_codon:yes stop_codon:yes gene_type:complete